MKKGPLDASHPPGLTAIAVGGLLAWARLLAKWMLRQELAIVTKAIRGIRCDPHVAMLVTGALEACGDNIVDHAHQRAAWLSRQSAVVRRRGAR